MHPAGQTSYSTCPSPNCSTSLFAEYKLLGRRFSFGNEVDHPSIMVSKQAWGILYSDFSFNANNDADSLEKLLQDSSVGSHSGVYAASIIFLTSEILNLVFQVRAPPHSQPRS